MGRVSLNCLKKKLTVEINLWVEYQEWRVEHVSRSVFMGPRFELRLEIAATQKNLTWLSNIPGKKIMG